MKRFPFLSMCVIWWLGLDSAFGQDPNILIGLGAPAHGVTIKANFSTGTGSWTRGFRIANEDISQSFITLGTYGNYSGGHSYAYYSYIGPSYSSPYMTFLSTGNIGIGTTNPQAKLAVKGGILAEEVKVRTDIAVPDYVFDPEYKLRTLTDIEAYVKEHKHLPDIPSAKNIERDGLDLAEMNLLLLKKVEELTLHLIEKEKQIQNLHIRLADNQKDIKTIKMQMHSQE